MRSRPTSPRSIAAHLVLLFTVAATLLVSCGLGVLYWIVVHHAAEEDAAVLNDKMTALRTDLAAPDGLNVVREELQRVRSGGGAYFIRVIDGSGQIAAETPGMAELLPTTSFGAVTSGERIERSTRGRLFSLATTTTELAPQRYTIQVAQDRTRDAQFYRQLALLLAAALVIAAGASVTIATRVARSGLRPLALMTQAVREVGAEQLDRRLPADIWPNELKALASAFNHMLTRLHESFTRLSQFSADLAHELRTPVANIRGEAEVALTRARTTEEYRAVVESTAVECQRLSAIIDNLLFLARAEAGGDGQLQRTRFDARAAAEKIMSYYVSAAEERNITIRCSGEGEIDGDVMLFNRALGNLIDNALRFTPDGGAIDIHVAQSSGQTVVEVSDTGPGIAPEHLPRVFDRFYRADSARSSGGTGLGLALVKSIAEMHGGSASVANRAGGGATVRMTFGGS